MRTYKIHLIRHGMTDGNTLGEYIGVTDLPLSPEGAKEIMKLKDSIDYPFVGRVYTSPLLRSRQTSRLLYPDAEEIVIDELKEYDFGDFEGKTASELESDPAFFEWTSGRASAPPNGEDSTEFSKRICLGLNKIVRDMMDNGVFEAAAVMHGGVIMTLLSLTAVPRRRSVEWMTSAGHGYTVTVTPSIYHSSGVIEVTEEF